MGPSGGTGAGGRAAQAAGHDSCEAHDTHAAAATAEPTGRAEKAACPGQSMQCPGHSVRDGPHDLPRLLHSSHLCLIFCFFPLAAEVHAPCPADEAEAHCRSSTRSHMLTWWARAVGTCQAPPEGSTARG